MSEQMTQNNRPVIRVAICGEVRSGKSAMLNALLRENIVRDNLGTDERPLVFAEYNEETALQYLDENWQAHEPLSSSDSHERRRIHGIRVKHTKADLAAFEFLEVPLTSAENLTESQATMVASCDIMIWVTIASQAWRLTEKQILDDLEKVRPRRSILAITRADKMRRVVDQQKLMARLDRETSEYFDARVLVANSRRQIDATARSATVWAASGAAKIANHLSEMAEAIHSETDERQATVPDAEYPNGEDAAEATAGPRCDQEKTEPDTTSTILPPEIGPLIEALDDGIHMGMYTPNSVPNLIVLNGDQTVCRKVSETCRNMRSRWMSAFGKNSEEKEDFGMVLQTSDQCINYSDLAQSVSLFSISHRSDVSHAIAQNKHSQIRKAMDLLSQ